MSRQIDRREFLGAAAALAAKTERLPKDLPWTEIAEVIKRSARPGG